MTLLNAIFTRSQKLRNVLFYSLVVMLIIIIYIFHLQYFDNIVLNFKIVCLFACGICQNQCILTGG